MEPSNARPPRRALSRRLLVAFYVITMLFPLVMLGAAELVCRARGFGGYPPVIERVGDANGTTWFATNRRGTNSFFGRQAGPGGGMRELQFASPAPPGTVRVVLLGESAIQGFPQQLPLTTGSFLNAMLSDAWRGERSVEVLDLGATAVASFPIVCYLDQVLEHTQPDLVVLMVGNNEFYGAYGMASLPRLARSPAGMRLARAVRGTGLSQWLQSLQQRRAPTGQTLMERAAVQSPVGAADSRRTAAAKTLRAHLREIALGCRARDVPIIVCTIPTNLRGMAPVGAELEAGVPADDRKALREELARAEALLATDPAQAEVHASAALAIDSTHARAHFVRGSALADLARHPEAVGEFVRARDLDTMPWRATSAAQAIARDAAAAGAVVCDMEAAFAAASPGGAIGWDLMDDHVHMSLRGQALFARTILSALASLPEPLRVQPEALASLPAWEAYAERLGHSVYSDYVAAHHMRQLFEVDFMRRTNEPGRRRFEARCRDLLASMSPLDRSAVERWHDPALHGATERPLEFVTGVYRMNAGDYAAAATMFRVARSAVAPGSLWRLELTWHLIACQRRLHDLPTPEDLALCAEAIHLGELLRRFGNAENSVVLRCLGLAYNMAGDHANAVANLVPALTRATGADTWEMIAALADSYARLGRIPDARRVLESAAANPPTRDAANRMLEVLEAAAARPR